MTTTTTTQMTFLVTVTLSANDPDATKVERVREEIEDVIEINTNWTADVDIAET